MTKPAAIRATYSDWKLIRTRGVVQLVFEVPLADADAAYEVIGGMPDPSSERWFAIAPLHEAKVIKFQETTLPHPRAWQDIQPAAQAGIRCNEPLFLDFLQEHYSANWRESLAAGGIASLPGSAAECVRLICRVNSRAQLSTDPRARNMWHQIDQQYLNWKIVEQQS